MEEGASDQPASGTAAAITYVGPLRRGFWIGAIFAAGAVASWPIMWAVGYALDRTWLSNLAAGSRCGTLRVPIVSRLDVAIDTGELGTAPTQSRGAARGPAAAWQRPAAAAWHAAPVNPRSPVRHGR